MKETVTKAWAVKCDAQDQWGKAIVHYQVWYRTELTGAPELGTGIENCFVTYRGEASGRQWNLAQQIAGSLNNEGE